MTAIVIAAGGTAGHVMPALAVAEELVLRGATVSFAGTPGRVEATLVPKAGYPFDGFEVDGLERRPSLALVRALARDAAAPIACARILRRRHAQVVLGGGGFVAGPMLGGRTCAAHPVRPDRGRCAPRAREPALGAARTPRVPRLPDRRS